MDNKITDEIMVELNTIAADNNVTILMAIESGSRSWGFPSPDSDYDVRFIYAHDKDWYLQIFEQKDVIELEINAVLDINGWDLKKALALAAKGNAVVFEWLNSPIIYQFHRCFETVLRQGVNDGFNPAAAFHHYYSLARKFMTYLGEPGDSVKLKKLFYLLRALLSAQWILQKRTIAPVEFDVLMDALVKPVESSIEGYIRQLMVDKAGLGEAEGKPIRDELRVFIVAKLAMLKEHGFTHEQRHSDSNYVQADWNRLFQQVLLAL
ncbi:MAG: nucleotidyltransferase domain-containing protein [Psychrosphaera sp.]|nr:nucleotidyltransferase domain-containing protein [Psychrosphaera sp.]